MIRGRNIGARAWRMPARVPFAVLFSLASAAHAAPPGSVSDYKLPPGPTTAPPPVQGPVDPDVPSARPTRSPSRPDMPQPATPSTGEPPRIVVPSSAPTASPTPLPQRRQQQRATSATQTAPAALPTASETEATQPVIEASPAPIAMPELAPTATRSQPDWLWIALAVLGALLACAGAVWMLRRRRGATDDTAETPVEETEPAPEAATAASAPASLPPVQLSSASSPPAPARPAPPPVSSVAHSEPPDAGLDVRLEASQLSRSLVYATLAYRLTLTNRTAAAVAPARVLADLISAHASLAAEEQLSPDAAALHLKHDVPALAPHEPVSLSGELRIPVATIRPIMQGGAALFVPLARFRIETADGGASDHVFVVGQPADQPGGALKPLRIDGLPGVVRPLDQRRVMADAA